MEQAEYCRRVCKTRCPQCPMPHLLPDAQSGVAAFRAVATQWRHGYGGRTGLDYRSCIDTLRMHLARWRREAPAVFGALRLADLMEDVQIIEHAILGADAERREEDEEKRRIEQGNRTN